MTTRYYFRIFCILVVDLSLWIGQLRLRIKCQSDWLGMTCRVFAWLSPSHLLLSTFNCISSSRSGYQQGCIQLYRSCVLPNIPCISQETTMSHWNEHRSRFSSVGLSIAPHNQERCPFNCGTGCQTLTLSFRCDRDVTDHLFLFSHLNRTLLPSPARVTPLAAALLSLSSGLAGHAMRHFLHGSVHQHCQSRSRAVEKPAYAAC